MRWKEIGWMARLSCDKTQVSMDFIYESSLKETSVEHDLMRRGKIAQMDIRMGGIREAN